MIKNITILGAGDTGSYLASEFSNQQQNFEVTIIDKDPNILKSLGDRLNIATVEGLGTDITCLQKAIKNGCDLFIACAQNDETNLVSCIFAKTLHISTTIAILNSQFYLDEEIIKNYKNSGVDYVLNIAQIVTDEIIDSVNINIDISEVTRFSNDKLIILGIRVTDRFPFINKKLKEIVFGFPCLIGSIIREQDVFIPKGNDLILKNDYIYLNIAEIHLNYLYQLLHSLSYIKKTAVVVGDNEICEYVIEQLSKENYQVKFISEQTIWSENLLNHSRLFNNITQIDENPFHIKSMLRANISNSYLFISLLKDDTKNIVLNYIANYLGAIKSIYLVNRKDLIKIANKFSGVHISKRLSIFRNIKKIMRFGNEEKDFTTIGETAMEVFTYDILKDSNVTDKAIKDIYFPQNSLVAAIIDKNDNVVIPEGSTTLKKNQKAIIFSLPKNTQELDTLFKE